MPYSAKAVANYLLDKSWEDENPVDPLKLQKLLYFAHGWHLGLYQSPLLEEPVEAWTYGPVIPSIYHEFKECGNEPIDGYATEPGRPRPRIPEHDVQTRALLDRIWQVYGSFSGLRLSDMTHKAKTPWAETWSRSGKSSAIPDSAIEAYFSRLASGDPQFTTR